MKRAHFFYTCMKLRINLLNNDQYVATDMINIIIIAKFFRLRTISHLCIIFYTYILTEVILSKKILSQIKLHIQ